MMARHYRLKFIEVLKRGEWVRTWWTCSPDDPDCKPALSILANRRLKLAQKKFPHATFRLVEAEEQATAAPTTKATTASPRETTALALPRFGTMQEGSILAKPQDVGGWIDEKLKELQDVG
jgi:hypothetical protein